MSETSQFAADVEAAIDGPDVHISRVRCGGYSGWEDIVEVACGKTIGSVFKLYDNPGAMPPAAVQMKSILPVIRKKEAERLAEEEALNSTLARLYV